MLVALFETIFSHSVGCLFIFYGINLQQRRQEYKIGFALFHSHFSSHPCWRAELLILCNIRVWIYKHRINASPVIWGLPGGQLPVSLSVRAYGKRKDPGLLCLLTFACKFCQDKLCTKVFHVIRRNSSGALELDSQLITEKLFA